MKYYKLNFDGFHDSEEDIFGKKVLDEAVSNNICDVPTILNNCANEIKNKIGSNLNINKVIDYQVVDYADVGNLVVCGQDQYLLLINEKAVDKEDSLISIIYHELCHLYQLERLFKEKIIFWNYDIDAISSNEFNKDLAVKHLNVNNGHTEYWQELADKINTIIKPIYPIRAYLTTEEHRVIFAEEIDHRYYNLNFDGFHDLFEDLFKDSKDTK